MRQERSHLWLFELQSHDGKVCSIKTQGDNKSLITLFLRGTEEESKKLKRLLDSSYKGQIFDSITDDGGKFFVSSINCHQKTIVSSAEVPFEIAKSIGRYSKIAMPQGMPPKQKHKNNFQK